MGAKKKPQETVTVGELGLAADDVGEAGSRTEVYALAEPPPRGERRRIEDDGNAADAILQYLAEKRLI
jgi:electron transfer flavoprotein beta subunit